MTWALAPHNFIFLISLLSGCMLAAAGLASAAGDDSGHDPDDCADHDSHGKSAGELIETPKPRSLVALFMTFLGFGRMPLLLVLAGLAIDFGVLGLVANVVLEQVFPAWFYFLPALLFATVGAALCNHVVSSLWQRFLPSVETYSTTKQDLVGSMGRLTIVAQELSGTRVLIAQVKDVRGDLHQIMCSGKATFLPGDEILVTNYSEVSGVFEIEPLNLLADDKSAANDNLITE